jgi:hypothetical protein
MEKAQAIVEKFQFKGALTPMLHKKDEENITNRYGCWGIAESASYFWNAPAVQRTFHTLKQ